MNYVMLKTYNYGIGMVVVFDKMIDINTILKEDLINLGSIIKSDSYKIYN